MLKKSLIVTTLAAAGIGLAALPAEARHHDDRAAGAIIGGTLGALIGSSVSGGDGALVGGVLGAVVGAGAAGSHGYYGGYYAPRYYGAPAYYAPRYGYSNGYYRAGRRDSDRDGVPNRYDRAPYNPRWR
jgi:hypothetical protein